MTTKSGEEIRQHRERLGWSRKQLADAVGAHAQTVNKIERGDIKHSRFILPMRQTLGIISPVAGPGEIVPFNREIASQSKGTTRIPSKVVCPFCADTISGAPLLLCFVGDPGPEDHLMVLRTKTLWIERPRHFCELPDDAYSLTVEDTAMAPRFERGDIVYVSPSLPLLPQKDVLLRKELGTNGGGMVILARLLRDDPDCWVLRQYKKNLPKDFTISKSEFPNCHRVVGCLLK